jgi:hypothetical protein
MVAQPSSAPDPLVRLFERAQNEGEDGVARKPVCSVAGNWVYAGHKLHLNGRQVCRLAASLTL